MRMDVHMFLQGGKSFQWKFSDAQENGTESV